jgi:hypothetical protein
MNDSSIYVPSSRVHTHGSSTISTRDDGLIYNNPILSIIYKKGADAFMKDNEGNYYYKNYLFRIDDGKLLIDAKCIVLPNRTNLSAYERLLLSLGLPVTTMDTTKAFDMQKVGVKDLFSTLVMLALKDLGIIPNSLGLSKQIKYGEVIFGLYLLSTTGSGKIKSTNPYLRWINEEDALQLKARIFRTNEHKKYQSGVSTMRYFPADLVDQIIDTALMLLLSLDFENNVIKSESLDFIIPMEVLSSIKLRDIVLLLNDCIGYCNGFVIRPQQSDKHYSRVYSVFTSISSATRKRLGFMNYDIGSALQTICMHLVADPSKYPLHQQLVNDRHKFREQVADEANKDIAWVKTELTSADNHKDMPKRYNTVPTLKAYFEEALILRKEIINSAEPLILDRAMAFAKPEWIKIWDEAEKKYDFIDSGRKKESSVFFFIWTQWERQIREAMMSCFDDPSACHQVHDAVYSRQRIDPKVIESEVLEQTGFKVEISAE